jgi:hypothetical protein
VAMYLSPCSPWSEKHQASGQDGLYSWECFQEGRLTTCSWGSRKMMKSDDGPFLFSIFRDTENSTYARRFQDSGSSRFDEVGVVMGSLGTTTKEQRLESSKEYR